MEPRHSLSGLDYFALALYFVVTASVGLYFSKRGKDTEHYFLGGRRVPWWAVGLSIYGTSLSSITYLAIPGDAFSSNWVKILANTGILFMAPLVVLFYLPRFRAQPISTAYEYLERRFNFLTRVYGSLVFVLFQVGRVSIVLLLPSMALATTTGMDLYASILLLGIITTIYTVAGGIEAVIWTDVMQSIVLVGGAVFALLLIVLHIDGGVSSAVQTAWAADKFHTFNWTWDATVASVWVCLIGNAFSTAYPATSDQCIVQRYLTTATQSQAARAVWTNALLTIPTSFLFFGIGTALWVFYQQRPEQLPAGLKNDAILPLFVAQEFPPGLAGLLIAGVFAAAMSTLSSSLNSVASVLDNDYYRRWRRDATDAQVLWFGRVVTLCFGVVGTTIALVMATFEVPGLFEQWLKILNWVGGGLAGVMALGVFTRRGNGSGAITGALVSAAAVAAVARLTPLHYFLHGAVGFITSFIVGYAASLLVAWLRPESSRRNS